MQTRWLRALTLIGLIGILSIAAAGCSSSETTEDDMGGMGEDIPELDAGTDMVPLDSAEQPVMDENAGDQLDDLADGAPAPAEPPMPMDDPFAEPPPAVANSQETAPPPSFEEPAPVAETSSSNDMSGHDYDSYTVQRGDTLMKIAFDNYGDLYKWRGIYELNREVISNPSALDPGVRLKLDREGLGASIDRNGEKYLIRTGDTLGKISDQVYGTSSKWRKIWDNNRQLIKDPNRIFAGFYLYYIPEDGAPTVRQRPVAKAHESPIDSGGFEESPEMDSTALTEIPANSNVSQVSQMGKVQQLQTLPTTAQPTAPEGTSMQDVAGAVPPPPSNTVPPEVEDPTQAMPEARVPAAVAPPME